MKIITYLFIAVFAVSLAVTIYDILFVSPINATLPIFSTLIFGNLFCISDRLEDGYWREFI